MFHTVYDSFESRLGGRDYIGKHTTGDPYDDYRGSFKDESFDPDDKIVIGYSKTPEGAVWLEIQYQRAFKVAEDPQFANQSYQNSVKFSLDKNNETVENKRRQGIKDYCSTPEGFRAVGDRTRGKVWYHLPCGKERRFDYDPGHPWILGRVETLGEIVKYNLDHASGGRAAGKLPWWYNPVTGKRKRQVDSPGEGWENRKGPNTGNG
jgi:hypothetical protein